MSEIEQPSNPRQLEKDIAHIKVTLDSLAYSIYKNIPAIQRMIYMTKDGIDKNYPRVKDIKEEIREEAVLPDKGKYKTDCHRCGEASVSTGVIFLEEDVQKHEFECCYCKFKENLDMRDNK